MTAAQLEFTEDELLSDLAGRRAAHRRRRALPRRVRRDGAYVSPRTKFRVPGDRRHGGRSTRDRVRQGVIDVPIETWGAHFPNVDQARVP